MRPFALLPAADLPDAVRLAGTSDWVGADVHAPTQFLAGGTTLLDLMKLDTMRPGTLVELSVLRREHGAIHAGPDGLELGALVRMSEAADHPDVLRDYPAVAQSLQLAASPQLRNMASLGGNVLQRTRCNYFRDPSWPACNKRAPGTGCGALEGSSRLLAVLGVSGHCIAHYPGDFAVAMVALGATLSLRGPDGERTIPLEALHRLPGEHPEHETTLRPGELIAAFHVPARPWFRRSLYLKVRDRQSYAFAIASAAVALDLGADGTVREARVALGGLAAKPWRAHEAEDALRGRTLDEAAATEAAEAAFRDAVTRPDNAFKPELGRRTLVRALLDAAALEA